MAIYVKSKKIEENENFVVYLYGKNPNSLIGKIKIMLDGSKWEELEPLEGEKNSFLSAVITGKILSFYKSNVYFPDEISRQS